MRFMAAPWLGLLKMRQVVGKRAGANRLAELLERAELRTIPNLEILHLRQANSVFVRFPSAATNELWRRGWSFYEFIGGGRGSCGVGHD